MGKRLFDILTAGAALLLLSPLLLLIALMVKLDSKGPVLFRQIRVGRNGRIFRIRKFRTMQDDAGHRGLQITAAGDPRITRIGGFLRRWKLDELPQLIDVFSGKMSVVGPRPEVPQYVDHWPPDLRNLILSVRPGLTDPAALVFLDENALLAAAENPHRTYVEDILPAKIKLYAEYAATRTMHGDLFIIFRTFKALASPRKLRPAPI